MKIRIKSDVYDIAKRLRLLDPKYFVVFDTDKYKYEVHNAGQVGDSYCMTIPYDTLDARTIVLVRNSRISRIDEILEQIDRENEISERLNKKIAHDLAMDNIEKILRTL